MRSRPRPPDSSGGVGEMLGRRAIVRGSSGPTVSERGLRDAARVRRELLITTGRLHRCTGERPRSLPRVAHPAGDGGVGALAPDEAVASGCTAPPRGGVGAGRGSPGNRVRTREGALRKSREPTDASTSARGARSRTRRCLGGGSHPAREGTGRHRPTIEPYTAHTASRGNPRRR